jgi:hypothetical protein
MKVGMTPATPPSGELAVYPKSDERLYTKDSAGTERPIGPATASGTVFQGTPVASLNITYPTGRFSSYPMVQITCTPTTNVALVGLVGNNTTTGCTVFLYGIGGTWTSGALSIYWHASEAH